MTNGKAFSGNFGREDNLASYTKVFTNVFTRTPAPFDIQESVKFPKSKKFGRFQEESQFERKFRVRICQNRWFIHLTRLFFRNFGKCCSICHYKFSENSNRNFTSNEWRPLSLFLEYRSGPRSRIV